MKFYCEGCYALIDGDKLGVLKQDVSAEHGLPEGSMFRNVNYCLDNPKCFDEAKKILEKA